MAGDREKILDERRIACGPGLIQPFCRPGFYRRGGIWAVCWLIDVHRRQVAFELEGRP